MKKLIRQFLNKRNYDIIRMPYRGDKYPNLSKDKNEYYCETPIGNYYLPHDVELDAVSSTLARGKFFEPEIQAVAKKYIREGSTVLDMGANFGQMSIEFSKLTGPQGRVFSFEAQAFVAHFFRKNIIANGCTNITLIENAVYNKDGESLFFSPYDFSEKSPYKGAPYSGLALISDSR